MSTADLQSALCHWFWQDPSSIRTVRSVENSCAGIFQRFYPEKEKRYAKYEILYPLVRYGTVEFYGKQGFGLAPTGALLANGKVLFTNLPDALKDRLGHAERDNTELPGQQVISGDPETTRFIKDEKIPVSRFDLAALLKELPPLGSVVASWDTAKIIDPSGFLFYHDQWRAYPDDDHPGVFKRADLPYAQRLCRLPSGEFKAIPDRDQQIDAFSLAVLWGKVVRNERLMISYDPAKKELKITDTLFPLVLERLLLINSLLQGTASGAISSRIYHLNNSDFKNFNRFFHNSIKPKYE